jgi:poly-gamma-glutamate synthesis protein (capsule biosynthesis protein)
MKISKTVLLLFLISTFVYANNKISITIGGDVMLDRGVRQEIKISGYKKYLEKYELYFKNSDFGIINLECAVTGMTEKTPKELNFKADKIALASLKDIGITHVNLANNHSIDYGSCGLGETIENAKEADLIPIGYTNSNLNKRPYEIIEKNGIKIAVFSSVILKLPDYHFDTCSNISVCQQFITELSGQIAICRKENPRIIILVLLHWGWENTVNIHKSQISDAEKLIESGADMIVGSHPHIVQNIMKIKGKYIFFSIGNMIFDGKKKEGMILNIKFSKNKKIKIKRYRI